MDYINLLIINKLSSNEMFGCTLNFFLWPVAFFNAAYILGSYLFDCLLSGYDRMSYPYKFMNF